MSDRYSVNVSGIAPSTTQEKLAEFFSFCGAISSIDFHGQTAVIHFEKPAAAKTALMLSGGALDGSILTVTSDVIHPVEEQHGRNGHPIEQSDKPRAGIAAEYLAKGYALSDQILERAIEIDNKQGISSKFLNYVHSLDSSLGSRALGPDQTISGKIQSTVQAAAQQAKTVDEQKGFSKTAADYYARALSSPFGKKVYEFYTNTSKQVKDIHEEARRIAAEHKPASSGEKGSPPSASGSNVPDSKPEAM